MNEAGEELEYRIVSRPPDSELKHSQDNNAASNSQRPAEGDVATATQADVESAEERDVCGSSPFASTSRKRKHEALEAADGDDDLVMLD